MSFVIIIISELYPPSVDVCNSDYISHTDFRNIFKRVHNILLFLNNIAVLSAIRKEKQRSDDNCRYSLITAAWFSLSALKTIQKQTIKHRFSSTESKVDWRRKFCYRSETKCYYEGEENRPGHVISRSSIGREWRQQALHSRRDCHVSLLSCL
jgi:hypothetical protein